MEDKLFNYVLVLSNGVVRQIKIEAKSRPLAVVLKVKCRKEFVKRISDGKLEIVFDTLLPVLENSMPDFNLKYTHGKIEL